jgi:hypothetical protein
MVKTRCKLGYHDWDGCVCRRDGCRARRPGATYADHDWDGCVCRKCSATRHDRAGDSDQAILVGEIQGFLRAVDCFNERGDTICRTQHAFGRLRDAATANEALGFDCHLIDIKYKHFYDNFIYLSFTGSRDADMCDRVAEEFLVYLF